MHGWLLLPGVALITSGGIAVVSSGMLSWVFRNLYLPPLKGDQHDVTRASAIRDLASFNAKVLLDCLTPELLTRVAATSSEPISDTSRQQLIVTLRDVLFEDFRELNACYWIDQAARCTSPTSLLAWVEREIGHRELASQCDSDSHGNQLGNNEALCAVLEAEAQVRLHAE